MGSASVDRFHDAASDHGDSEYTPTQPSNLSNAAGPSSTTQFARPNLRDPETSHQGSRQSACQAEHTAVRPHPMAHMTSIPAMREKERFTEQETDRQKLPLSPKHAPLARQPRSVSLTVTRNNLPTPTAMNATSESASSSTPSVDPHHPAIQANVRLLDEHQELRQNLNKVALKLEEAEDKLHVLESNHRKDERSFHGEKRKLQEEPGAVQDKQDAALQ